MSTRRELPYWLAGSGVVCCICEQRFVVESGFHCAACDRPVCGECVLVEPATGEVLCLVCRDADAGAE